MTNEEKLDITRKQADGALRQIMRDLIEGVKVFHAYDGESDYRTGELAGEIRAFDAAAHTLCDWMNLDYAKTRKAVEAAMKKEAK